MGIRQTLTYGLLGLLPVALGAESTFTYGLIKNNRYESPSGEFIVTLPIQPELGGRVTDTPEVVTFQDDFGVHASIACFGLDPTQRREEENRGRRDYLTWFFGQHVQSQFRRRFAGASIESARFIPELMSGALLVYNLLPGGSMFVSRLPSASNATASVAKRGNLVFVHHHHLYVISIELAEKTLNADTFDLTLEQQDNLLRERLIDLVGRMTFTVPVST